MAPKRILAVEPSDQSRQALEEIFRVRGDQLAFARDQPDALKICETESFDLVLSEVLLPRGSGYQLCMQLKAAERLRGRATPILLMGGVMRNFNLAHEARVKYGADDVLVKPFDARDLRRKLAIYLDHEDPDKQGVDELELWQHGSEKKAAVRLYVEPLRLSGSLSRLPFARVFGGFSQLGETGVLHLQSGKVVKSLYFQDGQFVYLDGGHRRECLGWLLVREHLLDHAGLIAALERMRETGRRMGETLLEGRRIAPHSLFEAMRKEIEEKAVHCFLWQDGFYWFEPAARVATDDLASMPLDSGAILRRGIMAMHSPASLNKEFEPWQGAVARPAPQAVQRAERLKPTPHERKVLALIDGRRNVSEIIDAAGPDLAAAQRALYAFICCDLVSLEVAKDSPVLPRNLLLPRGDAAYRQDITARFSRVLGAPPELAFGPVGAVTPEELRQLQIDASRGLFSLRRFGQADCLTHAKADAIFGRLDEARRALSPDGAGEAKKTGSLARAARAKVLEAELVFQKGLSALDSGAWLEAGDRFQAAIDLDDATADYYAYLGYALFRQKEEFDEVEPTLAIRNLNRALELDPHLPDAYVYLGHVYLRMGQDRRAEAYYDRALNYEPDNIEALKQLRVVYSRRQAGAKAAADAAATTPALVDYTNRVRAFLQSIQHANYFDALGVAPDIGPRELQKSYFDLSAQFRSGEMHGKVDPLTREQSDEIFQRLTVAYSVLADPERRRLYEAELAAAQRSDRTPPTDPERRRQAEERFRRGGKRLQDREYKRAVEDFGEAWRLDPAEPRYLAWYGYARNLMASLSPGDDEIEGAAARECILQALVADPGNIDAHFLLGSVYMLKKKKHMAAEQFENALAADPDHFESLRAYRALHARSGAVGPVKLHQSLSQPEDRVYVTLSDRLMSLCGRNCFEALGIGEAADETEAKRAYDESLTALQASFDPQQATPDVRFRANEIREKLDRAYHVLADPQLRACLENSLREASGLEEPTPTPAPGPRPTAPGEVQPAGFDGGPTTPIPSPPAGDASRSTPAAARPAGPARATAEAPAKSGFFDRLKQKITKK